MTAGLAALYQRFYDTYSKKYGETVCILLLVGKFYELYCLLDPDSGLPRNSGKTSLELMNIAVKTRPNYGPKGEICLWGGVPEQSLHKFARPLTDAGWTVVVVDQVKDPHSEEVIDRTTARILSPGTHIEVAGKDRMTVASLWIQNQTTAASIVDLTTGEVFSYTSKQPDDILHMLQVYGSKEVIVSSDIPLTTIRSLYGIHGTLHPVKEDGFDSPFVREEYLRKLFRICSLMPVRSSLGLEGSPDILEKSLCILLRFLEDHFPQQTERLCSHELFSPLKHMRLSNNILEQLNIITFNSQKSVLNLLERTHSAIGKRAMRERLLRPITDETLLEERWNQVEWAKGVSSTLLRGLERDVKGLYDLPRLHHQYAAGTLDSIDILQLFHSYAASICLIQNLRSTPLQMPEDLETSIRDFRNQFRTLFDEEKAQERDEGTPIGFLTPISGPLTCAIEKEIEKNQETWLRSWQEFCRHAKIPSESFQLKGYGDQEYVWEGPRSLLKTLQAETFVQTKTTLLHNLHIESKKAGPIQITCREFQTFTDTLRIHRKQLNQRLKEETLVACDSLWECVKGFQQEWIGWLGTVDCTLALASVAKDLKWCKPSLGSSLCIEGLRHPLLEAAQTRAEYVQHRVELGGDKENGWLIYGVNASGKSSLMKATGIAVILAQAGSFVPASSITLRPYDAAFSRIWSHDNLWAGLSSFAVEVTELRDIVNLATEKSLVLGDEVCSGTESHSATSLVASVLEYLHAQKCHFMFATHLHDLLKVPGLLSNHSGIAIYHLRVQRTPEGKLIYDRTLQPGPGSSTYGLEVARAMGLPLTLMDRAHEIRRYLEGETTVQEAPKSSWNSSIRRHVCEVCKKGFVRDLEVHHITPRCEGGGNDLRNLIVLCETCHDKHHAGELEIGELRQTSEGLERHTESSTGRSIRSTRTNEWNEEELLLIHASIAKFQSRPISRIITDLREQGITITPAQLRKLRG